MAVRMMYNLQCMMYDCKMDRTGGMVNNCRLKPTYQPTEVSVPVPLVTYNYFKHSKVKVVLSLIIVIGLLSGCSTFRRVDSDKMELLTNHLSMWRGFRLDGIIEITYRQLRLRKNVSITMDNDSFQLAVFDTGFFGLRPQPFLQLSISDKLSLEAPQNIMNLIPQNKITVDDIDINLLHKGLAVLQKNSSKIVDHGHFHDKDLRVQFDESMQITGITVLINNTVAQETSENLSLLIDYRAYNQPEKMQFFRDNELLFTITVDRIEVKQVTQNHIKQDAIT